MDCPLDPVADNWWLCPQCDWLYYGPRAPRRNCPKATPPQSRGLGDTVARITKALGIRPCGGCRKRQAWLNRVFPYRRRR